MDNPEMTVNALLQLNKEITDAIGACQHSLNRLGVTPELLSLNSQKSSLAAAEVQLALESDQIPSNVEAEQAIVKKEMVFINGVTRCLHKSNAASEDLILKLRQELELASEEYWSMKTSTDEKDRNLKYFIMKQDEYVKRAVILKENMVNNGVTAVGQYKSIIDYSINVNRSKSRLAELSKISKKYCNLPPDIQEAKIKLTKTKAEFKELDRQLQQKIVADI